MMISLRQLALFFMAILIFAAPTFGFVPEGNVSVNQSGGSLFINGDDTANGIQIGQFVNGDIFVGGLDCRNERTSVNGKEEYLVYSGVQNIFVNTKRGDDCIAVTNDLWLLAECLGFDGLPDAVPTNFNGEEELAEKIFIPGNLRIDSSGGLDDVGIGWFGCGGSLTIFSGYGYDEVGLCHICVEGELFIHTHNGNDDVLITGDFVAGDGDGGKFSPNFVGWTAIINTGQHDDDVCVENLITENGSLIIETLDGNDNVFVGDCFNKGPVDGGKGDFGFVDLGLDLIVNTSNGYDYVRIGNAFVEGSLITNLGNEDDDLGIFEAQVNRSTIVNAGNGDDLLVIFALDTKLDIVIHAVGGDDFVDLINLFAGLNFIATLGTGYDTMFIDELDVLNLTQIGAGNDSDFVNANDIFSNILQIFMNSGDDALTLKDSDGFQLFTSGDAGFDCFDGFNNFFDIETILNYETSDCDD